MKAEEYFESKGIDITTIVCYHYTNDPDDGINIDIEKVMEEYATSQLKESEKLEKDLTVKKSELQIVKFKLRKVTEALEYLMLSIRRLPVLSVIEGILEDPYKKAELILKN